MMNELNQVDLVFVVDTTASMGSFINQARRQMTDMLRSLSSSPFEKFDLRVGIVEYRDHPPQDHTFAAKAHGFSPDLKKTQETIEALKPDGGGDGPESVFDGLEAACKQLNWRTHSLRLAVLIGDAPPHGVGGAGDHFRSGCPCGLTIQSVTALFEASNMVLYSIGLTREVKSSFEQLATWTGGQYFESTQELSAIQAIQSCIHQEFSELQRDQKVLDFVRTQKSWKMDSIHENLGIARQDTAASLSRLSRRKLLQLSAS